ncbi:MAG: hypothetical protein PHT88_04530 [Candidatus Moranbacteria bacterium]|nr:hypothetical protein [Candidatus Moranbacteria bacterium]
MKIWAKALQLCWLQGILLIVFASGYFYILGHDDILLHETGYRVAIITVTLVFISMRLFYIVGKLAHQRQVLADVMEKVSFEEDIIAAVMNSLRMCQGDLEMQLLLTHIYSSNIVLRKMESQDIFETLVLQLYSEGADKQVIQAFRNHLRLSFEDVLQRRLKGLLKEKDEFPRDDKNFVETFLQACNTLMILGGYFKLYDDILDAIVAYLKSHLPSSVPLSDFAHSLFGQYMMKYADALDGRTIASMHEALENALKRDAGGIC